MLKKTAFGLQVFNHRLTVNDLLTYYALHSLIKLFKQTLWILKRNITQFQLSWKFVPDIPNSLGEIIFENLENKQTMYGLINVLATQKFRIFRLLLFPLLLLAKGWKLQKLLKLTFWTFELNLCIRWRFLILWVKSYVNEQKCKQWRLQRFA